MNSLFNYTPFQILWRYFFSSSGKADCKILLSIGKSCTLKTYDVMPAPFHQWIRLGLVIDKDNRMTESSMLSHLV